MPVRITPLKSADFLIHWNTSGSSVPLANTARAGESVAGANVLKVLWTGSWKLYRGSQTAGNLLLDLSTQGAVDFTDYNFVLDFNQTQSFTANGSAGSLLVYGRKILS